jgi:hypothetical protein
MTDQPQPQKTLACKWAKIMGEIGQITRDGSQNNMKFASVDAIYGAVNQKLAENNIAIFPKLVGVERREEFTQDKPYQYRTYATFVFVIVDGDSGEREECLWEGEKKDFGDRGTGIVPTNAMKSFLKTSLLLVTGEDDDGNATKSKGSKSQDQRPSAPEPLTETTFRNLVTYGKSQGYEDHHAVLKALGVASYADWTQGFPAAKAKLGEAKKAAPAPAPSAPATTPPAPPTKPAETVTPPATPPAAGLSPKDAQALWSYASSIGYADHAAVFAVLGVKDKYSQWTAGFDAAKAKLDAGKQAAPTSLPAQRVKALNAEPFIKHIQKMADSFAADGESTEPVLLTWDQDPTDNLETGLMVFAQTPERLETFLMQVGEVESVVSLPNTTALALVRWLDTQTAEIAQTEFNLVIQWAAMMADEPSAVPGNKQRMTKDDLPKRPAPEGATS